MTFEPLCPSCGRDAPLLYRGIAAQCSACGAARVPLSASSLVHKGVVSRAFGSLTRAAGWSILVGGLFAAIVASVVLQLVFPEGYAGYLLGTPLAILSVVLGTALLRGGKSLAAKGENARETERERAIWALAGHRGGTVTAREVARAHGMTEADADSALTEMAKRTGDVQVDIDDAKGLVYRFPVPDPPANQVSKSAPPRVRVPDEVVDAEGWEPPRAKSRSL